jgi:hypothetical protein
MLNDFMSLKKYLSVIHHISGRIRIKIDGTIINDPLFEKALNDKDKYQEIISVLPGLISHRLNFKARSLVINYDPTVIAPKEFEEVIESKNSERVYEILNKNNIAVK